MSAKAKRKKEKVDDSEELCYSDIWQKGVYSRVDINNGEFLIALPIYDDEDATTSFIFLVPSTSGGAPTIRGMDVSTVGDRRNARYIKCDHLEFSGIVTLKTA